MGCARFCDVKKVSEKNLLTSLVSLADISKLTIKDKASDKARIVEFVNFLLKDDATVKSVIPLDSSKEDVFSQAVADGVFLVKLLGVAKPGCYDEGRLNVGEKRTGFQITSNHNLAIDTIKDIGLKGYEGLKSDDFNDAEESLVSEIIEKLIKMYLFTDINAKSAVFGKFLEYLPLMRKPKAAAASAGKIMLAKKAPVEDFLLSWVNHQLRFVQYPKVITKFDEMDLDTWTHILYAMEPEKVDFASLNITDEEKKMAHVVSTLKTLGLDYFVTEAEIKDQNGNMFTYFFAQLLRTAPLANKYWAELGDKIVGEKDAQAAAYFAWLNGMGTFRTTDVRESMLNGVDIFYAIDKALPGKLNWTNVNKGKLNQFKAQGNWKIAMDMILPLTRFPPSLEVHELHGNEDKVFQLVKVLYEYDLKQNLVAKVPAADLLAWANEFAGDAKVDAMAKAGPAYLAAVINGISAKFACEPTAEGVLKCAWKLGFPTMATVQGLEKPEADMAHCFLMKLKSVMDMAC